MNETDDELTVQVHELAWDNDCRVEWLPEQVRALTQGDFAPAYTLHIRPRTYEAVGGYCTTGLAWIEVGDFSGIVLLHWWDADAGTYRKYSPKLPPDSVFLEGSRRKLLVTIGKELEVYPVPSKGPPSVLPDAGVDGGAVDF